MDLEDFNNRVSQFPETAQASLAQLIESQGKLGPNAVDSLLTVLDCSLDRLLGLLLPLAAGFSQPGISGFRVGAIAVCQSQTDTELYFGANREILGGPLQFSLHAEQAAIANAWLQGNAAVNQIFVTAAPCGYCRQFFQELTTADSLTIGIAQGEEQIQRHQLSEMLISAFSPRELGIGSGGLGNAIAPMKPQPSSTLDDSLAQMAFEACSKSYAPYTRNHSGCAIELDNGNVYWGVGCESVAYNPSLLAIQVALMFANLDLANVAAHSVKRIVFCECPTKASQRMITENIAKSLYPKARFDNLEATLLDQT